MTGWYGSEVLYFGDHPYSDLADVTLEHGWRTGAIINELVVSKIYVIYIVIYSHTSLTLIHRHLKEACTVKKRSVSEKRNVLKSKKGMFRCD